MAAVTVREAKTQLSEPIQRALEGKEPLVKLVPVPEPPKARRIGGARGLVLYMADDFDAPLELCSTITP